MKRHLFLIINNGGETNPLPNVARDKTNYLDFFQSPEGGYWNYDRDKNDKDITVYENDFTLNILSENIRFQKNIQAPYDYIVIVFCGHGFSENGEKWIEAKPTDKKGDHISLSQIKEVCHGIRTLFIADSCLSIPERQVFTESIQFNSITDHFNEKEYGNSCKRIYNESIMSVSKNNFTAAFAVSLGEEAADNERGGYYSQTLLQTAKNCIKELREQTSNLNYHILSFPLIHSAAAKEVIKLTNGKQHPSIEMTREKEQLPFIIVPKNQIKRILY